MKECLFCKIASREIGSEIVYEDENVIAFKDINPIAPIHALFINKRHTKDINDSIASDEKAVLEILKGIKNYTIEEKLDQEGFRVITNLGKNGGQSVFHTHFHLLAGKKLPW